MNECAPLSLSFLPSAVQAVREPVRPSGGPAAHVYGEWTRLAEGYIYIYIYISLFIFFIFVYLFIIAVALLGDNVASLYSCIDIHLVLLSNR